MVRELSQDLVDTQRITKVGTFYYDLVSNKGSWTDQAAINYGFKPGTPLQQMNWKELIEANDLEQILKLWDQTSQDGTPIDFNFRFIKRDGTNAKGVIRLRAEAVKNESGKVIAIRGTLQDISDLGA